MNSGGIEWTGPIRTANDLAGGALRSLTTMRILTPLLLLFLAAPLRAEEPRIHRDLAYVEPKHERQTLDVYAPTEGNHHPVVVWIHGGGWQRGDKTDVQIKPRAFVEKGFVFVSINYRFVPNVTIKQMAQDVA